ncbi:hypothetical protein M8998_02860 [Sphingobacterium sp. lm-10]|uniref:hypothetical protein n=1 Tax=Sphingobacterium sp. lm-10 TaxID=2944904 RepID=UPI00202202F8|nr:hypothetical protein [Sphingobacterium sp. lm-10]MCL7986876.1 hypothetical protein [Sphingobacterium sp. lm-10]
MFDSVAFAVFSSTMIRHILFFLFFLPVLLWSNTLEEVRSKFPKVVSDSELCKSLITDLTSKRNITSTEKAYLGALQTIWANHTNSPISKWKTFQRGKDNLEAAVLQSPNNVEIRLLRYSVQSNCPRFLNYYRDMEGDKSYIQQRKTQLKHPQVLKMYNTLFKS